MKKSIMLAVLLVVLGGVVCANVVMNREKKPDPVPDSVCREIADSVDQVVHAIARRDQAAMKTVWMMPKDVNAVRECIRKIGFHRDGSFELYEARYANREHTRISASGAMPMGNFAELMLELQNGKFKIVNMDIY